MLNPECSVQSEVKKDKSSLLEVRFNSRKMRFTSHLNDSSLLDTVVSFWGNDDEIL